MVGAAHPTFCGGVLSERFSRGEPEGDQPGGKVEKGLRQEGGMVGRKEFSTPTLTEDIILQRPVERQKPLKT
jgi:hypothetical protein